MNNFKDLGFLNFNIDKYKNNSEILESLSNKILLFLNEWWKKKYEVDNSKVNIIECTILSKDFIDLNLIKLKINNISQVKLINTKQIKLNKNIEKIKYYGDLSVLSKSLYLSDIIFKNTNGCSIMSK